MQFAGKTDVGKVRTTNQDSFAYGALGTSDGYAVLCDGMGGARSGNVASSMTCSWVEQRILESYSEGMTPNSARNLLLSAVTSANAKVRAAAAGDSAMEGMGTTVVAAMWLCNTLCIVNVGDSRAYLTTPDDIHQLTVDHSVVQMMVDQGILTEEQAEHHPDKNLITRAVGAEDTVTADYFEHEMASGESLLLCSDGLSNACSVGKMLELLQSNPPDTACEKLVDAANDAGGRDNITVVILTKDMKGTGERQDG